MRAGVVTAMALRSVVLAVKGGGAVQADARSLAPPAMARHRDVDQAAAHGKQAPQRRRGAVAECGTRAARQNRGLPLAVVAQAGVANCADTTVDPVQPARADAVLGRVRADSDRAKLIQRHHSMLVRRQSS